MPYKYDILIDQKLEGGLAFDLELNLKNKYANNRYKPIISFGGSGTECFNIELLENIKNDLKEYISNTSLHLRYRKH